MKQKLKNVLLRGLVMSLIPFALQASANSLQDNALFLQHAEDGLYLVEQPGLPYIGSAAMLQDPAVVWSHYLTNAVYNTTSNTVDGYVFAGTWLNPPQEAELFALGGGGTPEWGFGGTEFFTDAGDAAFTLAAVDNYGSGVNVSKWTGPDSIPDWSVGFSGYSITTYGPIVVSDDGSTIAVIAAPSGTDAHLLLFDADSSVPLVDYVASGLGFPRYVKINADGRYTAFIALATIVVFDRDLLNARGQISMGFSNSAMDISGDGNLLAYGWPSLQVVQWNGSFYQTLWSYDPGGNYYVSAIALSTDGTTIVSCWYTLAFNTLKVVVHDVGSSTPLWTYDYPYSSGTYQEDPTDVDITDDGEYFIVGSLGDDANLNPEVHIFQRDNTPHIYYTVDMPGSMFSVDIANDGSYATAAGKHIHANISGHGGDIVMINTDIPGITGGDLGELIGESRLLTIHPNPFRNTTQIRYTIHDAGYMEQELRNSNFEIRKHTIVNQSISESVGRASEYQHPDLKIYDAAGKLVRGFRITPNALRNTLLWDGRDDQGKPLPNGIYFVELRIPNNKETRKIILVR